MRENSYSIKPFPTIRQATVDLLATASQKHMIHGLIEVDVTRPRRLLQAIQERTGESLSFTGFIIHCVAQAVAQNRHMHACRDWRGRLVLFDHVDVSTTVEREVAGRRQVVPAILRAADRKSLQVIHQEIRRAQAERPETAGVYKTMQWYLRLPAFLRRGFFRLLGRFPQQLKQHVGTVMVTSVGMFGQGAGWGLPVATHTLNVTVGGLVERTCLVAGQVQAREHLCLTLSFDHDIIDGAPAARFIQRFKTLLQDGHGLPEILPAQPVSSTAASAGLA